MAEEQWDAKALKRLTELTDPATGRVFDRRFTGYRPTGWFGTQISAVCSCFRYQELSDLNAELTFALLFIGLGFSVAFEPTGDSGPDLSVSRDGLSAHVKSRDSGSEPLPRRKRLSRPTTRSFFVLTDSRKRTPTKFGASCTKNSGRLRISTAFWPFGAITTIWNPFEHRFAVDDMRRRLGIESATDSRKCPILDLCRQLALFSTGQKLYCRPFRPLMDPFQTWADQLEALSVRGCLGEALKKLAGSLTKNARLPHQSQLIILEYLRWVFT